MFDSVFYRKYVSITVRFHGNNRYLRMVPSPLRGGGPLRGEGVLSQGAAVILYGSPERTNVSREREDTFLSFEP